MLQLKVFILKLLAVNRFSTGAIASRKVSALDHEAFDDTMKARA